MALSILSGGAAEGLLERLAPALMSTLDVSFDAAFGAVGTMRDRYLGGEPADVLILTRAAIDDLVRMNHVAAETVADLGIVETGIAVRTLDAAPDISTGAGLRSALQSADAIHVPDMKLATAGIHFGGVLRTLGIADEVASNIRAFPNGAAAMTALAANRDRHAIGCTQVTEIKATAGVRLIGTLPREFALATRYAAAVTRRASDPVLACRFVEFLTSATTAALRREIGFEP